VVVLCPVTVSDIFIVKKLDFFQHNSKKQRRFHWLAMDSWPLIGCCHTLAINPVISHEWWEENENGISPFIKPHLSTQINYPSKYCHIYMYMDKSDRCLSFFIWPLCWLSFDLWLLATSLVSSTFSSWTNGRYFQCTSDKFGSNRNDDHSSVHRTRVMYGTGDGLD
jgi:hypothetical protein